MSCPTCSVAMQKLVQAEAMIYELCPRCGTLRVTDFSDPDWQRVYVPDLVQRWREFQAAISKTGKG